MASERTPPSDPDQPMICHIRIEGHLGPHWSDWFEGLAITLEDNGETLLSGPLVDQAALHGLMRKVRDLGIPLLSVVCVKAGQAETSEVTDVSVICGDQITATGRRDMKAIVRTRYGSPDVLQLQEVEKPVPKDDEVLVQVHAASVNTLDWHVMRGQPFPVRAGRGLRKPKDTRLGVDLAGRVEAVGANVTQFQVGDEVFGIGRGAFAEFACAAENSLVLKPTNLSYEAAAAVPISAVTALQGVRDKGQIQAGEQVLIQGASGGVGTFAVQIAKALGADVTAVCSTRNVDQAVALGADHVIDYTQEDFTRKRGKQRQRYDLIVAVNGYHPLSAYLRTLRPNGRYVLVGASTHVFRALFQALLLGP